MSLKSKLDQEKPWAKLRKSRKEYEADKPWKRARMSREKFEEMVTIIPDALIDEIKINADAEALLKGVFGEEAFDYAPLGGGEDQSPNSTDPVSGNCV